MAVVLRKKIAPVLSNIVKPEQLHFLLQNYNSFGFYFVLYIFGARRAVGGAGGLSVPHAA